MRADEQQRDSGAALILVLIVTAVAAAIAMMMLVLADTEVEGAASTREGAEAFYAADAALEAAIDELAGLPSWTPALSGAYLARWTNGGSTPATRLSGTLDLPALTAALQAETNASAGRGPDNPAWRVFGHAHISVLSSDAGPPGDVYVVVWIADDEAEADGNPSVDGNDTVRLHAEARGRRQSRRMVEAAISRGAAGVARLVSWREVR